MFPVNTLEVVALAYALASLYDETDFATMTQPDKSTSTAITTISEYREIAESAPCLLVHISTGHIKGTKAKARY